MTGTQRTLAYQLSFLGIAGLAVAIATLLIGPNSPAQESIDSAQTTLGQAAVNSAKVAALLAFAIILIVLIYLWYDGR